METIGWTVVHPDIEENLHPSEAAAKQWVEDNGWADEYPLVLPVVAVEIKEG